MKENSIEEALEKLSNGKKIKMYELLRTFKREGIENFVTTRRKYVDVILSDYKRVLKENEEYSKQLDLDYVDKNYISKQKIKDEIEELKGKLEDISRRREKSKTKKEETVLWCLEIRTDERIKTLQELL